MVRVDNVYQKVLALANKEQRGYITPQEFNLFADLAQMEIFEQYFYDKNQFERAPGNSSDYSDMVDIIDKKISPFKKIVGLLGITPILEGGLHGYYRLGKVWCEDETTNTLVCTVQETTLENFIESERGALTKSTHKRPVYYINDHSIIISPASNNLGKYKCSYIKRPSPPNWTYVIQGTNALYDPMASDHRNFELDASEENGLVLGILKLAGVSIKDFNLAQLAGQEEIKTTQQQKQ